MNLDKSQLTKLTNRQKAIAGVVVLVVIVVLWQVISLFGGEGGDSVTSPSMTVSNTKPSGPPGKDMRQMQPTPAKVSVPKPTQQQEDELTRLQQETQMRYILALNDLQMLKLSQEVAETNKSIAEAKQKTVKAQKEVVDMLTAPPKSETPFSSGSGFSDGMSASPPDRSQMSIPAPQAASAMPTKLPPTPANMRSDIESGPSKSAESAPPPELTVNYVMVSVSQLLNKWSAIITYKGKFYSVFVGDVLPPDGSTVVAIDKYSIILEKNGEQRKVSMVPII